MSVKRWARDSAVCDVCGLLSGERNIKMSVIFNIRLFHSSTSSTSQPALVSWQSQDADREDGRDADHRSLVEVKQS